MIRRRLWTLVLPLVLALMAFTPIPARADQEVNSRSHAIAIAYDDSGSMYDDGSGMRWCNAKYGLEVIAAMLGEQDEMVVFEMEDPFTPAVSVSGNLSMAERVDKLETYGFGVGGTLVDPSRTALSYLESSSAEEKYLIVMTDGEFLYDGGNKISGDQGIKEITKLAKKAYKNGIRTIYLAVDRDKDKAGIVEQDEAHGISAMDTTSDDILDSMVSIANQVFGRAAMPEEFWNAKTGEMKLDIPMSKVVVLAQGKDVKLGELTGAQGSTKAESAQVSCSQVSSREISSKLNDKLHGKVAIFEGPMEAGDYTLSIKGAESVAVYYMPYVDIAVNLTNPEGALTKLSSTQPNKIREGDYDVSMELLDPFTGTPITSKLVDGAQMRLEVTQGGQKQSVEPGAGTIHLDPGDATLMGIADVPGGVRVWNQYQFDEIRAKLRGLTLDVTDVPETVRYDRPGTKSGNPEGTVVVTKEDGSELTSAEWELMTLDSLNAEGLTWDIEKTDNPGVFKVKLTDTGKRPGFLQRIRLHMFTPFTKGLGRKTTFTAEVSSVESNLGGEAVATTHLTGAFKWWIWVIIAIILAIVTRWLTKPRLPQLTPAIDIGDGQIIPLARLQKTVPFFSLRAERGYIGVANPTNAIDMGYLQEIVGLAAISLEAVKSSGSTRMFRLGDDTVAAINAMLGDGDECTALDTAGKPVKMSANTIFDLDRGGEICTIYFTDPGMGMGGMEEFDW